MKTPQWRSCRRTKYLLVMLTIYYFLGILDRGIFSILSQSIKVDLRLTDLQLGLLGGIAFALFYGTFSVPAARLAERGNRLTIISVALTFWSLATAASGAATNFIQMALARAGVGAGEAACHPCAHSLIADSYPPHRRASAASLFSLAIPAGTLFGLLGGAYLAQEIGWRWAFVAVGVPGVIVAVIAKLTLVEPTRGQFDPPATNVTPPYSAVLRHLFARPTFVHLAAGWTLTTIGWSGGTAFMAPFLLRGPFDLEIGQVGWILGLLAGVGSVIGTVTGGFITDRFARVDVRIYMWVPAASMFVMGVAFAAAVMQSSLIPFIACSAIGNICMLIYTGPSWGTLHNLVEARMRASTVATLSVIVAVVGAGLGPVITGLVSDLAASYADAGDFTARCVGSAMTSDATCRTSSFLGLRYALVLTMLIHLWAGVHYLCASRSISRDLVSRPPAQREPD